MAAVAEITAEAASNNNENLGSDVEPKSESVFTVQKLVDMFTKLNPLAKEFFPSSFNALKKTQDLFRPENFAVVNKQSADDNNLHPRRRNSYNQGKRRLDGRAYKAQREDSIRRTVYVSDIDQHVTEERLAGLFSSCGQVVDCRVCGDPHSVLRFAFVEFADDHGAREALNLGGTMLGYYPVRVLPSKTAILPVNPTFLPRSENEREMCSRTVYCTNIDKKISQAEVKNFFESTCGEVTRLRLLGDHIHSSRIAFVEFAMKTKISQKAAMESMEQRLQQYSERVEETVRQLGTMQVQMAELSKNQQKILDSVRYENQSLKKSQQIQSNCWLILR